MKPIRWQTLAWLSLYLCVTPVAFAQTGQKDPHIGYVYPAGGRQGTTVHVVIGGQYLDGVTDAFVSGQGVKATEISHTKPLTQREVNLLRDKLRQAREKLEAAKKDGENRGDKPTLAKFARELGVSDEDRAALELFQKQRSDPKRQLNPQIAETVLVDLELASDAEPGKRELRLQTPAGLTNPLSFCVGDLPEFSEIEPNDEPDVSEVAGPLPVVLNGQIMPGDVDRFRFSAEKGTRLVVSASARELMPYLADAVPGWFQATLALSDADGREVAYADDFQFHPDPVLYYRIPADGEYTLEIKDAIYRGREDFVYRITLGELPFVTSIFPLGLRRGQQADVELTGWNLPVKMLTLDAADRQPGIHTFAVPSRERVSNEALFAVDTLPECMDEEPNDDQDSAQSLRPPVIVNGRIDRPGDWDVFHFPGRAGGRLVVEVQARKLNSPLDSWLKITDATGRQLMVSDDYEDKGAGLTTHHADSRLSVAIPETGAYYLHLGDTQNRGGMEYAYRLRVSGRRPDYALRATPSSFTARPGRTVPITVYALRRDEFDGDITLVLKDAPPGFTLSGGWIPAGHDKMRVTLTVPTTPVDHPISLGLEGHATVRGREIRRPVVPADDMMQAFIYHHLVPAQDLLVSISAPLDNGAGNQGRAKTASSAAMTNLWKEPIKLPAGGTVQVDLPAEASRILARTFLQLNEPPEGISIDKMPAGPQSPSLVFRADSALVKPGQKGNLIVEAYAGRTAGRPQNQRRKPTDTLPAIPFEIVELYQ